MGVYVGSTCSTRRSVPILWMFATSSTQLDCLHVDLSRRKKSAAEAIHHVPPAVWMSPPAQVRVGRHPARAPLPRLRRRPRRFTSQPPQSPQQARAPQEPPPESQEPSSTCTTVPLQLRRWWMEDVRCQDSLKMGKDPLRAGAGLDI